MEIRKKNYRINPFAYICSMKSFLLFLDPRQNDQLDTLYALFRNGSLPCSASAHNVVRPLPAPNCTLAKTRDAKGVEPDYCVESQQETRFRIYTDSRAVTPGSIFWGLKGEHVDGTDFIPAALERGARLCVGGGWDGQSAIVAGIGDPAAATPLFGALDPASVTALLARGPVEVRVPDALDALQRLATLHRGRLDIPIIALTGTNGKTTTKELINSVLKTAYRVTATQGNFNNHLGVPLTLLSMDTHTQIGLVEMGASHPQDIAELLAFVQPTHGLITNVGKAHLQGFGSLAGVMACKGALYTYLLTQRGTIFYNMDDPLLVAMLEARNAPAVAPSPETHLIPYGPDLQKIRITAACPFMTLQIPGYKPIKTQLVGDYNAVNVLAALAVANAFSVDPTAAADAIAAYTPQNNRSQWMRTANNHLVVDAYNANPSSVAASLSHFANLNTAHPKMLILGDMRELGSESDTEHAALIERLRTISATRMFLVGPCLQKAYEDSIAGSGLVAEGAPAVDALASVLCFPHVDALCAYLQATPLSGYTILIKGSNSLQLTKCLPLL